MPSGHPSLRYLQLLVLLSLSAASCVRHHPARRTAPANLPQMVTPQKLVVEPGDTLNVQVFDEKELSGTFQVSEAGTIDYPLIGRVDVAGKLPSEVSALLQKRLADGYIKKPYVSVLIEGYQQKRKVYVWGQVAKPGTFNYMSNMSLIEAITLAGGLTPLADKDGLSVSRMEGQQQRRYPAPMGKGQSANFRLKPGDVIFVPESVF